MKLTWSRDATNDLTEIRDYVSADDPGAAGRLAASILDCVASLRRFRDADGPGASPGRANSWWSGHRTSSPIEISGDRAVVVRVLHAARRWPTTMGE